MRLRENMLLWQEKPTVAKICQVLCSCSYRVTKLQTDHSFRLSLSEAKAHRYRTNEQMAAPYKNEMNFVIVKNSKVGLTNFAAAPKFRWKNLPRRSSHIFIIKWILDIGLWQQNDLSEYFCGVFTMEKLQRDDSRFSFG